MLVGLDSAPELQGIARRTVESLGAMGAWGQGNAFPETFSAAVRAGVDPMVILGNMTLVVNRTMPRNILGGEGQECAGAVQAINDMLCSSYGGVLRPFGNWNKTQDAAFSTLRAKGGFLVTGAIKAGTVGPITIVARQAGNVTMLSPWSSNNQIVVLEDGSGSPVPVEKAEPAGAWSWPVQNNGSYTVKPKPALAG